MCRDSKGRSLSLSLERESSSGKPKRDAKLSRVRLETLEREIPRQKRNATHSRLLGRRPKAGAKTVEEGPTLQTETDLSRLVASSVGLRDSLEWRNSR